MYAKRRRAFRLGFDSLDGRILLSATPLTPAQIRQAYSENINFTVNGRSHPANGAGQTIAIVDAGYDLFISNDLKMFDQKFGLSAPQFTYALMPGAKSYFATAGPSVELSWVGETSLDVEWAHVVAPAAKILLVGAASSSASDLMSAVNYARHQPGVSVVSMSFGLPEAAVGHAYDSILTTPAGHTGVTFVASSGDFGFYNSGLKDQIGVQWPAADPTVVSVGGTNLHVAANGTYLSESAWSGSGGGYSGLYAEPSYQQGVQSTGVRTVPDVAYNSDSTGGGFWIYDTLYGGWIGELGTSAGAPQWAGLIALADQGRALVGLKPLDGYSQTLPALYQFSSDLRDIKTGSNGYLATRGYDPVTGLGTPIGYKVVNDLAFKVPTSFIPTSTGGQLVAADAVAIASSQAPALPAGATDAPAEIPTLSIRFVTRTRPVTTPAIAAGPGFIALGPDTLTATARPADRRHDHLDLALRSLQDDEIESLFS
jgi:subtilase family serine protease